MSKGGAEREGGRKGRTERERETEDLKQASHPAQSQKQRLHLTT